MPNGISFNGVAYDSVDDMPPDVRRDYERLLAALGDENRDGVITSLEGARVQTRRAAAEAEAAAQAAAVQAAANPVPPSPATPRP